MKLIMILTEKISKSGEKILHFLQKNEIKKHLPAGKIGF
jgi:hypothetical protein